MPLEPAGSMPLHNLLGQWVPSREITDDPADLPTNQQLELWEPPPPSRPFPAGPPHRPPAVQSAAPVSSEWHPNLVNLQDDLVAIGGESFPLSPTAKAAILDVVFEELSKWQATQTAALRAAMYPVQPEVAVPPLSDPGAPVV